MECSYVRRDGGKCQFGSVGIHGELALKGKYYCLFHYPKEEKIKWDRDILNSFAEKFNSLLLRGQLSNFTEVIFPPDIHVGVGSGGNKDFSDSYICKNVTFTFSNFIGSFRFDGSTFESNFNIASNHVGRLSFRKACFSGNVIFSGIRQIEDFDCQMAEFSGQADFSDIDFRSHVSFARAVFQKAPIFLNCKFPQNVSFHHTKIAGLGYTERAESSYRHVRTEMGKNKARDYEGKFYVFEQRCARKRYGVGLRSGASWLYDLFSEYGTSFERAFIWLFGVQIISFGVYLLLAVCGGAILAPINSLVGFTLAQLFRPFEIFSVRYDQTDLSRLFGVSIAPYIQYVSAVQAILSLSLLALFFLALRWRFKRE